MRFCPECGGELVTGVVSGRQRLRCPDPECGFVHWDNPVPVVAAIVEKDGVVVLARNKGWPEKMYGLVAGFLEKGETPEEGVAREVQEELGLAADAIELVGVYSFAAMNQVIVAFHVTAHGEIVLGEELAGVKLVPPDRLRPWPVGTGPAVRDWLAKRGSGAGDG